jgi:hypothetical protein
MGFGREGAICEYFEIMQIPPRFERQCGAYKCIRGDLQDRDKIAAGQTGSPGAFISTQPLILTLPSGCRSSV